jgi:hypothetical protein
MRRKIVMTLLALGAVAGIGGGVASLAHRGHCGRHGGWDRHAAWHGHGDWREREKQRLMNEFAQACVAAARRAEPPRTPAP